MALAHHFFIVHLIFIIGQPIDSDKYEITSISGSWFQTKSHCESKGKILATFDNLDDILTLTQICRDNGGTVAGFCYLGFHDTDFNGEYTFIDDDEVVSLFPHFIPGEPDGNRKKKRCGCISALHPIPPPNLPDHFYSFLADCPCRSIGDDPSLFGICEDITADAEQITDGM